MVGMIDMTLPTTEVKIAVAISDIGMVECIPYEPYNVQCHQTYLKWKQHLKDDAYHSWQISILSANIPVPCIPEISATVKSA
jgi:hypothetical protein